MKKYIAGLLTGIIISLSLTTFAAIKLEAVPSPFPILVDGIKSTIEAYSIKGSTYIKLADLKAAGVEAKFNSEKKQIEINTTEGSTTIAEPVLDKANAETELEKNSVLEVTSTRTLDGLTVYTAGGEEYVYRYDIIAVLQKKNDIDDSKYKDNASYYLNLPINIVNWPEDTFVILTVGIWGTNEDVKTVNLSEPIKVANIMVYKQFEPRLSNDKRKMECIKLDDYEKYIKPILNSDKTLKEIYNSYAN